MPESCRRISRGQVWFLVDNDVPLVHTQGSIQGKNRPWLVVSNNKCNQSSTTYTVVPLTTANKNDLPTHVSFTMNDKQQTILCEQIRTVSQQAFFNAGSAYKWTMSEKYMELVDEALAVQLGLSLIFPNSERFWESLERLIRARVKQAIADSKVEAIDISKMASMLDAKTESILNETINPQPEEKKEEPAKEEPAPEQPQFEEKRDFVPIKKSKRNAWTVEEKEKFLEFYDKFGAKATAAEYDLQLNSVYTLRYKIIRELNGGETE